VSDGSVDERLPVLLSKSNVLAGNLLVHVGRVSFQSRWRGGLREKSYQGAFGLFIWFDGCKNPPDLGGAGVLQISVWCRGKKYWRILLWSLFVEDLGG